MHVNQIEKCTITNLGHDGEGVGQIEGRTVFVHGALPGETVRVQIEKVKSSYAVARLIQVIESSVDRRTPPCTIYDQCGGCQLQHGNDEAQLNWKWDRVYETIRRIGKLEGIMVHPVKGMQTPWNYRNKVQVPVNGKGHAGFYERNSHRIIPFTSCPIQQQGSAELVNAIVRTAKKLGIPGYDEQSGSGWLRHVLIRIAEGSGEWMVVLVTRAENWPNQRKQEFIDAIRQFEPRVVSIYQNVNPQKTNVILGPKTILCWGKPQIEDVVTNNQGEQLRFAISPQAFYQVNTQQMKVLYDIAAQYAALTGDETVIDAYCGIGTIALYMAGKAKKIYGVEIVPQAIEDARQNAQLNHASHVHFEVGDASDWMKRWAEQGIQPDVLILDPPRKGCDALLLDSAHVMNPKRIVYVSCDVATFARDAAYLSQKGWQLREVQPVDLFPQTAHIEVVGLFTKK